MEGRQDPFYYIPSIVELEKKIRKLSTLRLRDFIIAISSGATPSVKEEEKFYSDELNGVPFIRVQNLSPTNELMLNDLRYINQETHQKYLNRSQIKGGDLLVKITGVGRMAVSSVVPEGFEGNTNQHLVVIKTKDYETSEILATFLNTDVGEKLASRRATGGTRPALDYSALKSIPIVFKPEIIEIVKKAVIAKRAKEAEAKSLLDGIDAYLLERLGIETPAATEAKKTFFTRASKLFGGRFDPFYHQVEFEELEKAISKSQFDKTFLRDILIYLESGSRPSGGVSNYESGVLSFGGEHINNKCEVEIRTPKYVPVEYHQSHLATETKLHDIILVKDGATTGKIGIITSENHVGQNVNEHVFIMRFAPNVSQFFILNLLATSTYQKLISRVITGATVTGLTKEVVKRLVIPLPPLDVQEEIAAHIQSIRTRAKELEEDAKAEVERAKVEVEKMILGEVSAE